MSRSKGGAQNRLAAGLSEVLKERRVELGVSQAELATRAGLHRTYISEVERGAQNITIETLSKIADALETTVLVLMEDATNASRISADPIEIVLAEDNPADVHIIERCLKSSKIPNNLTVLRDGKKAIDYLNGEGENKDVRVPDLIFLDLHLPKINGFEILEQLKSTARLRQVPIVVLTNSESSVDISKCYELYANTFVTKPATQKEFQDAINKVLDYWFGVATLPSL